MALATDVTVDRDIAQISKQLDRLSQMMYISVSRNKALKRNAAKSLEAAMYLAAPKGETGRLKRSIKFLPFRKSQDVFVGPDYKIAPHAHLVEFGHKQVTKEGRAVGFVEGKHFIQKSYNYTKETVLNQLIKLAQKEFEAIGRKLEVRP